MFANNALFSDTAPARKTELPFFSLSLIRILMAGKAAPPSVISHATEFLNRVSPLRGAPRRISDNGLPAAPHTLRKQTVQRRVGGGGEKKNMMYKKINRVSQLCVEMRLFK